MVDLSEINNVAASFVFQDLLDTEYFKTYKQAYVNTFATQYFRQYRNYSNLIKYLNEIYGYNVEHAKGYAKRLRAESNEWRNCEAIFTEIIVYRSYIRLIYQGIIKSIKLENSECDLILELSDGTLSYYEVFCVMPPLKISKSIEELEVHDIKTHTQDALSSIRQKVLNKIDKQKQLSKKRNNFLVIEINESLVANDFVVLSSLSSGYKITYDKNTLNVIGEGFDWSGSIFNDERLNFLKGIIYFFLGDFESHKILTNPNFNSTT